MEWTSAIRKTIQYIEAHIKEDMTIEEICQQLYLSPMYLQKGFQIVTGYTIGEYIRNRRLYLAALDIKEKDIKIIDAAFDYGYETPESFSKAFTRFHGNSPSSVKHGGHIRTFLPLSLSLEVHGGDKMEAKIRNLFGLKVIGFKKEFNFENSYQEIPKFWDEICEKYANNVYAGNAPANAYEQAIVDHCIGEYGICIDDPSLCSPGKFLYLVAGKYTGGDVPEGMMLYEFPQGEWAIFDCIGPLPHALQSVNTHIFKEWLPGNPDYELRGNANVEWYDCINGEKHDADYHSAIWIPVKRKS